MTTWGDPEHLRPGRQTDRLLAWRDEDEIWRHRTRVTFMKVFCDHPVVWTVVVIVLTLGFLAALTLLSAYAGFHPLVLPGGAITLLTGGGLAAWRHSTGRRPPTPDPTERRVDLDD